MRVLALLILVAGCAKPAPPHQGGIVSLLPSWTEVIVELGAGDRLTGCTSECRPGRDVPRVPWQGARALEAILRLKPALVVRQAPRTAADPLRDALEEAGVPVLSLPSETIADVRAAILAIGRALGREAAAEAYVEDFDRQLAATRAKVAGLPAPRVLFVFGRDPGVVANLDAAGPGSFLDELIGYAGGRNVLAHLDRAYARIRLETVVRLEPEVIIDNLPPGEDPLAAWAAFETVPAVRTGRVYAVHDNRLLIPGPRLPEAVARLAELIHGRP